MSGKGEDGERGCCYPQTSQSLQCCPLTDVWRETVKLLQLSCAIEASNESTRCWGKDPIFITIWLVERTKSNAGGLSVGLTTLHCINSSLWPAGLALECWWFFGGRTARRLGASQIAIPSAPPPRKKFAQLDPSSYAGYIPSWKIHCLEFLRRATFVWPWKMFSVSVRYKQLLDEVFVITRIIKVGVGVISRRRMLKLITLTETLIVLDITKTESNNCFIIHWTNSFFLASTQNVFKVCANSFFSSGSISFFSFT